MKLYVYLMIIFLFFPIIFHAEENKEKIGISMLYSPFRSIEPDFHIDLENKLIAEITGISLKEFLSSNIQGRIKDFKNIFKEWKNNELSPESKNITNELSNYNYFILFEVSQFIFDKEQDFYNTDKYYNVFKMKLDILVMDCAKKIVINEDSIIIDLKSDIDKNKTFEKAMSFIVKKMDLFIEYQIFLREKYYCSSSNNLFVWLSGGRNQKLKVNDVLVSYENEEIKANEKSVIKVIKVEEDSSIAIILYTHGKIKEDEYFLKKQKINLELQLGGGFYLADKDNQVSTKTDSVSFLTDGFIRGLIPVGIPFFRPAFEVEFNFFIIDNKFLMPFTFETGCQVEFNIHRFGIDAGFLFGAMFSPDINKNYKLDSVVLRPYIHLSFLALTHMKLFGEAGYRYVNQNIFYKDWEVDMKGAYFCFGFGFNL